MKKEILKKLSIVSAVAVMTVAALTGCGNASSNENTTKGTGSVEETTTVSNSNKAEETQNVRVLKVARNYTVPLYNYNDADGNPAGFETELIQEIFNRLPQYEIEFYDANNDDLVAGIEVGKYDFGIKTAFYTTERAEKFIIPEHYSSVSVVGLVLRAEDSDIKSLEDFAAAGKKMIPIAPSDAMYFVIDQYNKEHADNPIELVATDTWSFSEGFPWTLEGRYDGFLLIESTYEAQVDAEDGPYHEMADQLTFSRLLGQKTYPLFNKENQDVADAYDEVLQQLIDDGTYEALEEKYFGEDLRKYAEE